MHQLNLLIVEDSSDDVFFFRRTVGKAGIAANIQVVEDGLQATQYLSNQGSFADQKVFPQPDIIFMDLKLPHLNGFEVLQWMRQELQHRIIPVIILSSSNEPTDRERAQALGAIDFHSKPILPATLHQIILRATPRLSPTTERGISLL